jgi:3-oxoacyl-[acyl-carrier protein] reductase
MAPDVLGVAGKCAIVTGGSRGVGAATAELLAQNGVDVAIGYRSRGGDAARVVAACEAHGVRAFAFAGDIANRDGAAAFIEEAVAALGRLDFFVANAGIWPVEPVPLGEMEDERWMRTMRENVDSVFFTTRAAIRAIANDGRMVMVASTAGQRGEADHADYAASKGAMISLVKSLCVELAPRNITVNCVAPGWIDTEMAAVPYADGGRARIEQGIPLGRVASAADIAGPIVFLCSRLARHVTGEILNVNGGSVLCG